MTCKAHAPKAASGTFTSGVIGGMRFYNHKNIADKRGGLVELSRLDEIQKEFHPVMSYVSFTQPVAACHRTSRR